MTLKRTPQTGWAQTQNLGFGACSRQASTYQLRPSTLPSTRPSMPVQAAVGRLKLAGLGHAETPIRQRAESLDQIAGLGHEVHDATVEQGSVGTAIRPQE